MADLRKLKDKAAELAARGKLEKAAELYREAIEGDRGDVSTRPFGVARFVRPARSVAPWEEAAGWWGGPPRAGCRTATAARRRR